MKKKILAFENIKLKTKKTVFFLIFIVTIIIFQVLKQLIFVTHSYKNNIFIVFKTNVRKNKHLLLKL